MRGSLRLTLGLIVLVAASVGLGWLASRPAAAQKKPQWPQMPRYAEMEVPADNPMSEPKIELGKMLFYDMRMSADGRRACFFCHLNRRGLTNGKGEAQGAYNVTIPRSPPTLWNAGYYSHFFWDGRAASLEEALEILWSGPAMGASGEGDRPSMKDICAKLEKVAGYREKFRQVFGEAGCTPENATKAVAAFVRTIVAVNSAWARYQAGIKSALSEEARRGYENFKGKARCTNCHDGVLLTDQQFHNVGIGWDPKKKAFKDTGRFQATGNERDRGAFKTPTLLDINESAPYFHDGSALTLEEAVDVMLKGGFDNPNLDRANLRPPVKLTDDEREDLLQFLRELTVNYTVKRPDLPK